MTKKLIKGTSLLLAIIICVSTFIGIGSTTVFAAAGEKTEVYLIDYPRDGDSNYYDDWGHREMKYMNGWKDFETSCTGLRVIGSYFGNIAYCIEPGTGQDIGDILTEKNENYSDNYASKFNKTISGDDVKIFIGRILQYGYQGGISSEWYSQNKEDAPKFEGAVEMKSTNKSVQEEKPVEESNDDSAELLSKLLSKPETAALLKALAKSI